MATYEADKLAGITLGKYHIEKLLGEGGMAYVYKGRHTDLDHTVAIKVLFPEFLRRDIVRTRFKREARVQCKLLHPNIVRVIDLLEADNLLGMVMDLVDGSDFAGYLKKRTGPMTLFTVRRLFLPILDAMAYAHSEGVVHRDLKPHNLMLHGPEGNEIPKVMDFGIARSIEDDGFKTKTGVVIGTPYYISPEQAMASKDIDHRTDIYALGITLFQMLTGNLPYVGESAVEVISGHCFRPVPSVRDLRKDLDAGIDEVVQKALAKKPQDRFQSCEEFAKALERVLPRRGGDTDAIGGLPSLDEVKQSQEELLAMGSSQAEAASDKAAISLHTRIEGWKQGKGDGPHPPLPSVSSSLPAVPDGYIGDASPPGSQQGLPSGVAMSRPSRVSSPDLTPWLLAAVVILAGGIGAVWALGGFSQLFRRQHKTAPTARAHADRNHGRMAPSVRRQESSHPVTAALPDADASDAPALKTPHTPRVVARVQAGPKVTHRQPARRRLVALSIRKAPRRTPRQAPPKARIKAAAPSKSALLRCQRCIKQWFRKIEDDDIQGHNPHALGGGACNHEDFVRVAGDCSRTCQGRYFTFCKSYLKYKTNQCQDLVISLKLLFKLRHNYPDNNKLTALRCRQSQ